MEEREDCFAKHTKANGEKDCITLTKIDCEKCHFYRNDIKRSDIESDIKTYALNPDNHKKRK